MRQLYPSYREDLTDDDLQTAYAYPTGRPGDRPWVRANMVTSLDGSATVDGRSEGLSSPADKKIFGILRGLCDVVLVGAGTARTEGYRALTARPTYAALRSSLGQRPAPVLALVSRRLDLDPTSGLFHGGPERTVVVTTASSPADARDRLSEVADVVVAGDESVDLRVTVGELVGRRLTRILCEGGPSLLGDVVDSGCLDELCLTFAPRLTGAHGRRILAGGGDREPARPAHVLEDGGVLLTRYTTSGTRS